MRERTIHLWWLLGVVLLVCCVLGLGAFYMVEAGGGDYCTQSGVRGVVRWDRYATSTGSIEEHPVRGAAYETVTEFVCNDGSMNGRIDRYDAGR